MLAMIVAPRADNMTFQEASDLGGDLLHYYAKRTYSYSSSVVIVIVCIVKERILYEEIRQFIDEEEKEIAKSVMVAARLSKSLSRSLVPVVDWVGNRIVAYATVGYEEIMFIEIMRYLLARLHFRKSSEVGRGGER